MNEKIYSVELTSFNIEQIIGSIKCSIEVLSKNKESKMNSVKIAELRTLLNYLESIN